MSLKEGSKGREVVGLQMALGIAADGHFGAGTKAAVEEFQRKHGLTVDGIAGPQTLTAILETRNPVIDAGGAQSRTATVEADATTDAAEKTYSPYGGLTVHEYFLPRGEYKEGPTDKEYLFLHHTAGWNNPYRTVDDWANDSRGAIATEFVLGGPSIKGNDDRYDGELVQCLPEGGFGWHLGDNGSRHMHTHSVAIEVCNFGYAVDGRTYAHSRIVPEQLVELPENFRGYSQWHAYSDQQLETLKRFILWIAERDSIDVRAGLVAQIGQKGAAAFEFNEEAYYGKVKGMWTHTNTRRDKFDLSPQPRLLDMLLSL